MNKNLKDFISRIKKAFYSSLKVVSILYLIFGSLAGVIGAVMSTLIVIEFISSFLETALGFLNKWFVIGYLYPSDDDDDSSKDGQYKRSILNRYEGDLCYYRYRQVFNVSKVLSNVHVGKRVILQAKEAHSFLQAPYTRERLLFQLTRGNPVFEGKNIEEILVAYIDHFGNFNFNNEGELESITLFVPKSEKHFMVLVCLFEHLGVWKGGQLVLRDEDIDDLLYEVCIDRSTGLDKVIRSFEQDGLLGYKFSGDILVYLDNKGWLTESSKIGNLSESRLYGILIITMDIEQYLNDFALVFTLGQVYNSDAVSCKFWGIIERDFRECEFYRVLKTFIGVNCPLTKVKLGREEVRCLRIYGEEGFNLFYSQWGHGLMGGKARMCFLVARFYSTVDTGDCSGMHGLWKARVEDEWTSAVELIEYERFERYRVPREERMKVIHEELFRDFKHLPFDFNCRSLVSVYSILCYGLCVRFKRDWSVLEAKDLWMAGLLSKSAIADVIKALVMQKYESPADRKKRGEHSRAERLRDGFDYTGNASKYEVCCLSPTSRTKIPTFKHTLIEREDEKSGKK